MRDPLGLNHRFFAWWYPRLSEPAERAGLRAVRRELLAEASGRACEIGTGHGGNLAHYPATVTELVITEPSVAMLRHLAPARPPVPRWSLVRTGAERLPFADNSFDTVVGTFVHCTIPDPAAALREVARVLRPGGKYLFLEHVRAADGTLLGRVQDLVELPHRYLAAGCHPNRRTDRLLRSSPLSVRKLEHGRMPNGFPTVLPTITGVAVR